MSDLAKWGPLAPAFRSSGGIEALILPALPLLASTQFCMEVLLRGSVLDLRSVREVLSVDPCALLHIFATTAEEFPSAEDRPQRLDECIIGIGIPGLLRALRYVPSTWQQQARLNAFAEQGVATGRCAQNLAVGSGLCQETAYLVGLLHALGTLPAELNNPSFLRPSSHDRQTGLLCARELADRHHLPPDLKRAILSVHMQADDSPWPLLIEAAHQVVGASALGGS